MNDDQLRAAALAMETGRYGSFAEFIGRAYLAADPNNRDRLTRAFADLFAQIDRNLKQMEIFTNE